MFSSFFNNRKVRSFSIVTSKDLHRKDLPIEQRLKFQSLQYQTPSRSKKKTIIYTTILAIVIGVIIYLNVSHNVTRIKVKIDKNDLEKVVR